MQVLGSILATFALTNHILYRKWIYLITACLYAIAIFYDKIRTQNKLMGVAMIVKNNREKVIEIRDDRVFVDGADYTDKFPERFYVRLGPNSPVVSFNRVVCEAAHGKPKEGEGKTVIHIDGDKNNIRPSNLKWGKHEPSEKFNEAAKKRMIPREQVLEIVEMLKDPLKTQYQIASEFGIHKITVSLINRGLSYQDITGIDPNRKYPTGKNMKAMPTGGYLVTCQKEYKHFDTYEEAKAEVTRYYRDEFYGAR